MTQPRAAVRETMPSPPGAIVDNCEKMRLAERVIRDALLVVQQHTGRALAMKKVGRELDTAAKAIGVLAVDTAKKVDMQYALHQRLKDAKTTMHTPERTPFQQLQNFTLTHSRKIPRKNKSVTCDRSPGDEAEVRNLRDRFVDVDLRWPRPGDGKVYTAMEAIRTIWESREGSLFRKGGASAVVEEMLTRKLLPVGRSQVLARFKCFRDCLGTQTSESAIQEALSCVKPFGITGRPSFMNTKKLQEWAQKSTKHDAVITQTAVRNFCTECKKEDAIQRGLDVASVRPE